ncbi:MAG: type II secretion system protein [Phycisphaerales bacterium]|nr:type II secretion system protein [Phycisphaerales bacterium]
MDLRASHHGSRPRLARGMTLLEVVFATVILGMAVATLASAVGAISGQQKRTRQLLDCAELANRLIIEYLDDPRTMPSDDLTLTYGDTQYRYRKSITQVKSTLDETVQRNMEASQSQSRQTPATPDRLKKIVVTVWVSERSGGSAVPNSGAPQYTLVRMVDPLAITRRPPDSVKNLVEQGPDVLIQRIMGTDVDQGGGQ